MSEIGCDLKIGRVWTGKHDPSWQVRIISFSPDGDVLQYQSVLDVQCVSTCDVSWFVEHYEPQADMVNHPPHYKDASGIECIEVTKYMGFVVATASSICIEQVRKVRRLKI